MLTGMEERVLDAEQWRLEAEAQLKDFEGHVKLVQISPKLGSDDSGVHLNVTTLEDRQFCVHLSPQGFRVVGHSHDSVDPAVSAEERAFETPYSLLSAISPSYQNSMGQALFASLSKLQQQDAS
ncbi:hypothetical protein B566_EDAN013099 [Ephemera danica]|nr:hypothetical protein B566_EDAN013099 [Ephemera danica]